MSFLLFPDLVIERFDELSVEYLREKGIRLLLSDLDNTLALHKTLRPTDEIRQWIATLRAGGITVMIVSNNRGATRVTDYCRSLDIPFIGHAGKPKKKRLLEAMKLGNAGPEETVLLGDQIFTDVLGANRCHFTSIAVEPICGKDSLWHWIAYYLQDPFRIPGRIRRRKELSRETGR